MFKHIKHEGARRAHETLLHGKREYVPKGGVLPKGIGDMPGLRAVGTIAYATIYDAMLAEEKHAEYFVERRMHRAVRADDGSSHEWVTSSERFKSIERARTFVASFPPGLYRVVVRSGESYAPDVEQRPKGKRKAGFW